MANYDFSTLSPYDFELLCRDLLSKHYDRRFESFAPGRDGGTDLRSFAINGNEIIVQCKHYKTYTSLKPKLKSEKAKVEKLNPSRYIFATSVDLTKRNKDEIFEIFAPHIKNVEDILGKQDLNQLLTTYPSVERNHFKLWLSSTTVLQRILHNGAFVVSESVLKEVRHRIKYYVQNESFNKALEILKEQRVIVITGVPGVGKTTLAYMLTYHLLIQNKMQFLSISSSISEGFDLFNEHEAQIFLFDDFLGRNFLQVALSTNEDDKLTKFIKRIQNSKNKILICTTREYILNQALNKYERLQIDRLEINKFVLDISRYTQFVKAEILYNHLFFEDLGRDLLEYFVLNKLYISIINHRNYNPRLIEFLAHELKKAKFEKDEVKERVLAQLDNPADIWKFAFENDISKVSQYLLLVMLTCGDPVFSDDLFLALSNFLFLGDLSGPSLDELEYNRCLKELDNSFITTVIDADRKLIIRFQNPGVSDFLINYLSNLKSTQSKLIRSAIFLNQLCNIFGLPKASTDRYFYIVFSKPIELAPDQVILVQKKIVSEFDEMTFSTLTRTIDYNKQTVYRHSIESEIDKLIETIKSFGAIMNEELIAYFSVRVATIFDRIDGHRQNYKKTMRLLELCFDHKIRVAYSNEVIVDIINNLSSIDELEYFNRLEFLLYETFGWNYQQELRVDEIIMDIIHSETPYIENDEWENKIEILETLDGNFGLNLSDIIDSIRNKFDNQESLEEDYSFEFLKNTNEQNSSEDAIHILFNSLIK